MSGFSLSSCFLPCFFSKSSLLGGRLVFRAFWEDNFLNLTRKLPWFAMSVEFILPFRHYQERRVNDLGPSCRSHFTFVPSYHLLLLPIPVPPSYFHSFWDPLHFQPVQYIPTCKHPIT
ncbi:unnamed protein product [Rangifer tarandus platyrhynchus]|uniref:Uncharacterized protein n=1 Tax=Rangifer tarandus platyrhynchus TaxID=3082113 RepID=A0ABN8ZI04_RANTA|nr:unnamed protein product [Rangifer tarandus platyrhynchus]